MQGNAKKFDVRLYKFVSTVSRNAIKIQVHF